MAITNEMRKTVFEAESLNASTAEIGIKLNSKFIEGMDRFMNQTYKNINEKGADMTSAPSFRK